MPYFIHMEMLVLNVSILRRNVGVRLLVFTTRGVEMRLKIVATKLSTITTLKIFKFARILIFYKGMILKENIKKSIFEFYGVEPCEA